MRIAYISVATPFSRASWSGIPWYSHREILRRYPDTHVIETPRLDAAIDRLAVIERKGVMVRRREWLARRYSALVDRELDRLQPDAVVAVAAAHKIAYINPRWPLLYVADAMFATVVDYYNRYSGFGPAPLRQGNRIQRAMLDRATHVLLGSKWAVEAAHDTYDIPVDRMSVLPLGANLDADPPFEAPDLDRPLTLMFMGYDWQRKGGDIALAVWRRLRERTGNAEFHIVGAQPHGLSGIPGLYLHGKLNKTDAADYQRIVDLFGKSHFFIMPSRQEAYGIVFCEAAAFGRPAVATATGGVTTIIQDGRTGLLLAPAASPQDYADRILALWQDRAAYSAMCRAARQRYATTLNWKAWGDRVADLIDAVGHAQPPPAPTG
jgi:glycosyltransferase involved in cell wall biosynthesis